MHLLQPTRMAYMESVLGPNMFVVNAAATSPEAATFNVVVVVLLLLSLAALLYRLRVLNSGMGPFVLLTYASRIGLHLIVRELKMFAHEKGGDALQYERVATWIARQWDVSGIRYMTDADNTWIGKASLPQNVFALMIYANGSKQTDLACTGLVAFCLCVAALNFYFLALELGAAERATFWMTVAVFSMPSMIYYSCDMYKDAIVLVLVLGAVGSSIRLSRSFSARHLVIGLACLFALWFVRFYMVFMSILPMLVGYIGLRSKNWSRPLISLLVVGLFVAQFAGSADGKEMSASADQTFTLATGAGQDGNRVGGSAVALPRGIGSLPLRLVYTLLAPFPWMGGTTGLHLGKVDTLFFYFLAHRATQSSRRLFRTDKATLLSLAAFIVPTTVAYAMTMSNIGLMLRQRVPVVVMVALLAVIGMKERAAVAHTLIGARGRQRSPVPKRMSPPPAGVTARLASRR